MVCKNNIKKINDFCNTFLQTMRFITQHIKWLLLHILLLLVLFISYRLFIYQKFNVTHENFTWKVLWYGFRFDMRMIAIIVLPAFLFSSFKVLNPFLYTKANKFWQVYFCISYVLIILFFVTDYQYYAYRTTRLDAEIISFIQDAAISAKMVWQSYPVIKILFLLFMLIISIVFCIKYFFKKAIHFKQLYTKKYRLTTSFIFVLLLSFSIFGKFSKFPLRWSDSAEAGSDYKGLMALNPIQSFFSSLHFTTKQPSTAQVLAYRKYVQQALQLPTSDSNNLNFTRNIIGANTGTKPNIVLVICESYAMYKTSMTGNPLNPTPYFNALRKDGIFFTNCFSPAYGTSRGVWATITGIPDVTQERTASRNPMAVKQHTILNDFEGYEKFYFLGGDATWANIRGLLKTNIRDLHLYEEPDFSAKSADVWGVTDRDLFVEATAKMNGVKNPFFTVIQTSSNHRPFTIVDKDRKDLGILHKPLDSLLKFGFNVESNDKLTNAEYNSVRQMDFCINEFLANAKKQPWYNNTIFLFIGDHGIRGQGATMIPNVYTDKGLTCQHIPMLIYSPLIKAQQYDFPCSQLDVLPTLAGLAGISYKNTTLGRDILKVAKDSTALKYAFIMDHDRKEYGLMYDGQYFVRAIDGSKEELVPVYNTKPTKLFLFYKNLTEGLLLSSQFLIFNNK